MTRRSPDPLFVPLITAMDLVEYAEIQALLEGEDIRLFKPPSDSTGLMGPTDNHDIYVHRDDEEEAVHILERAGFFSAESEPEETLPAEETEKRAKSRGQDLFLAAMLFILLAILLGVMPRF